MSTLTLAVEDYLRPSSAGSGETLSQMVAANCSRLAPELRPLAITLGSFLKSTPELVTQDLAAKVKLDTELETRTKDDLLSLVLWARAGPGAISGKTGMDLDNEINPFVEEFVKIPQVIEAFSKMLTVPAVVVDDVDKKVTNLELTNDVHSSTLSVHKTAESACAPPLRKLKLSLKLPKLTKLHSMSFLTPKSVRFAPSLEKIKMFNGKDSPSTVSLQCSPSNSPKYEFPVDDYFSIRKRLDDVSDDESYSSEDSDSLDIPAAQKQYQILQSNFTPPQNIYDKRHCPVYLQSVSLTSDKQLLLLLVMCQNLAFEKKVSVKMTSDNWQSQTIFTSAIYIKLFTSVNFDQFQFTVPLMNLGSSLSTQFCVCYDVNGSSFWDNNDSKNYKFEFEQYRKPSVAKNLFSFKSSSTKDSFTYKPPVFSPKSSSRLGAGPLDLSSELLTDASVPKTGPTEAHYKELVNKLMSVKDSGERPKFTHSPGLSPKPRYSQSYMAKRDSDHSGYSSPLANRTLNANAPSENLMLNSQSTFMGNLLSAAAPETRSPAVSSIVRPQLPHSFASDSNISSMKFNSMSYSDLLQNYCFNGATQSSKKSYANSVELCNSSCTGSCDSIDSGYMTAASTFQAVSDSFFV